MLASHGMENISRPSDENAPSIKKEKYGTINIDSCNGLQELKHIVLQYSEGNTGFMLLFAGF